MRRRGVGVACLALVALSLCSGLMTKAQKGADMSANPTNEASDREKAGLRGPIRSVEEERIYPSFTASDGTAYPELKSWQKTEYGREGRIAAMWTRDSSREHGMGDALHVTRYAYNAAGQLVRRTFESDGNLQCEIVFEYDDKGRLKTITNSKEPDNPIAFRYDAGGRKTKIAIQKPVPLPEGTTTVSRSMENLFGDEGGAMTSWDGGSTITLYDERDRPIEVQIHDTSGALNSRAVRVYDQQGRVIEEKMMMEDPLAMIPAAQQKTILKQDGVTAQELRDQISNFLGGSEMWSEKFSYDQQGRKITTVRNTFNHMNESTTTSYNEHGDPAKEISQSTASGTGNPDADGTWSAELVFTYEYDANGNWTLKKTSSRNLPDGILKDIGDVTSRRIEYF